MLGETLALPSDHTVCPFGGGSILVHPSIPPPTLIYLMLLGKEPRALCLLH